jgi:hypothetical protein
MEEIAKKHWKGFLGGRQTRLNDEGPADQTKFGMAVLASLKNLSLLAAKELSAPKVTGKKLLPARVIEVPGSSEAWYEGRGSTEGWYGGAP